MRKPFTVLWVSVLLFSTTVIVALVVARGQRQAVIPPTEVFPPALQQALVVAPTRALANVVAAPVNPEPSPTSQAPTSIAIEPTEIVVTPRIDAPRLFFAASGGRGASMLANYCVDFGSPVSLRLFDWMTGATVSLSDEAIARVPLSWDASDTIWQGYKSARPFDQPDDAIQRWKINLFLPDGNERWIEIAVSPQTPEAYYVYTFQKTIPYANERGEHFGYHPCRAFAIASSEVQAFLTTIEQYQDVVRYPPLITGDDSRWVRGTARPTVSNADLRSIPTTAYNDPIASISQTVTLWYARDAAWGSWAQVKLGSVQGWVDTALVSLAPEA